MDITSCKAKVLRYLTERPATRDDDRLLYRMIVEESLKGKKKGMEIVLDAIEKGEVPHFESVRRCRQKLQEHCKNLRGNLYHNRHKNEKYVQEQLYFNF
jgi:hypothetical protein